MFALQYIVPPVRSLERTRKCAHLAHVDSFSLKIVKEFAYAAPWERTHEKKVSNISLL